MGDLTNNSDTFGCKQFWLRMDTWLRDLGVSQCKYKHCCSQSRYETYLHKFLNHIDALDVKIFENISFACLVFPLLVFQVSKPLMMQSVFFKYFYSTDIHHFRFCMILQIQQICFLIWFPLPAALYMLYTHIDSYFAHWNLQLRLSFQLEKKQ